MHVDFYEGKQNLINSGFIQGKKIRNNKIKRSCKIEICRAHIFKAEALSSIIYGCSELYDATTLK